jgi:hypothetical protein
MDTTQDILQIKRWELNAIVIELVVLSGVAIGVGVGFLGRLPAFAHVPFEVLFGIGFAVLGILQIPGLSLLGRLHYQHQVSVRRSIEMCLVSAVVYIAVARLLHFTLHW